jgi:pyruvate kinase
MRRTKIVATVGPATSTPERLHELILAGTDVFRLNFSHAGPEQHGRTVAAIRETASALGREVGVLGDLPGPKIRVGEIEGDVVELEAGEQLELTNQQVIGNQHRCSVTWSGMSEALSAGTPVFLADGAIRLRVLDTAPGSVRCEVEVGGPLSSHKGINLPDADVHLPAVDEADLSWVDFAVEHGVDLLAVSFVRRREDLAPVEERLRSLESDIPLIAKIEKPQAATNAEEIVQAALSGIMVARGDLGIELPLASVPVVQKRLLAMAGRHSKPSITATQMLASMVSAPRPTRAEVTDVANAIFDGTDAVMLSEETAVGSHPIEAVKVLHQVATETEPELPYGEWLVNRVSSEGSSVAAAVAQGAVGATYRLDLAAIVVPTRSGRTARLVSAYRPKVPVLAVSPRIETVRRMNLLFGVQSVIAEDWTSLRALLDDCARLAGELGLAASGDKIAVTAGLPEQQLGTNLFEVHRVP